MAWNDEIVLGTVPLYGEDYVIRVSTFPATGQPALLLEDSQGYQSKASVALPGVKLGPGEILIKNWGADAESASALYKTGLFVDTGKTVDSGFVKIPIWRLKLARKNSARKNPRSTGYVAAKIRANTARRNSGSLPRNKIYAPPNVVRQGDIRSDLIHDDRRAAIAAAQVLLVRMRSAWLWYDDLDIELEDGHLTTSQVPAMEKRLVEADLKRYFPDLTDFDLKRVMSQVKGWGSVQPRDKMDKLARAAVKIRD